MSIADPGLLDEVKDRLYERGFDLGANLQQSMVAAIRTYEKENGLPDAEQPTKGLLQSLRGAVSLQPWGAITVAFVAGRVTRWGMSWGAPTRREALAIAKSRCGSDQCNQDVSFHGKSCGAFALSSRGWSARYAAKGGMAKDSALEDCTRRGGRCRIIGSVCADGSEKTN
jgi:hypothetical protein